MAQNLVVQLLLKTGTFSQDLKSAKGQIQNFQKGCQGAGDAVSAFTNGLGVNMGVLTKYAPYAAAAAAAGKVLRDSFMANTDAMDSFNREAEAVKSTYRLFSSQLFKNGKMTVDFGGVAEQAREYYNALDNAQTSAVAINTQLQLQNVEYDRLFATAMDVSLSEVDRLEALNEASNVLRRQFTLKKQMAQFDKLVAKEGLENQLVSRGITKQWLEGKGQSMLRDLLQFNPQTGVFAFDDYYNSVNTLNARTAGHKGVYGRTVDMMSTAAGTRAVKQQAKAAGYEDVNAYLQALMKEEEDATAVINSTKYQLAQALHNLRGTTEGYESISKYVLLVLNDLGLKQVDAENKAVKAQIERLRKRIQGGGSDKKTYVEGSEGWYEQEIDRLEEEIKGSLDENAKKIWREQIEGYKATLKTLRGEDVVLTKGTEEWLSAKIQELDQERQKLDYGLPETQGLVQKMNDWKGSWEDFIKSLSEEEKALFDKFGDALKRRWDILNQMEAYSLALLSGQGNKTPAVKTESYEKQYKSLAGDMSTLTSSISTLTLAFLNMFDAENEALNGFRSFINALATGVSVFNTIISLVESINSLTKMSGVVAETAATAKTAAAAEEVAANTAVAASGAAASQAAIPGAGPVLAVAAIAAIIAAIASAVSSSSKMKFANGGIVGGSSFTGDRITAQVNSGEMILNRAQQANLFRLANGGGVAGGQVEFHISGTDLVGVLNNYNRKNRVIR